MLCKQTKRPVLSVGQLQDEYHATLHHIAGIEKETLMNNIRLVSLKGRLEEINEKINTQVGHPIV